MRADFKDRNSHMRFYSDIMNKQRTYLLDSHFENVNGSIEGMGMGLFEKLY